MILNTTRIFRDNAAAYYEKGIRRALNEGGTSSSKTYSIIQLLVLIAKHSKENILISIVSESLPHLRRGCIRDFMNIMGDEFEENRYNKSEHKYNFNHAEIEFFPADDPSKMRGGRRDILYENECNNITYNAHRELDIRTKLFTFMDWNPVSEFWVHENGLTNNPENKYIHSTYLDARGVLPVEVIKNIESNKDRDPNWWNVYGLGRIGKIEGLVYPAFEIIETMPEIGSGKTGYGLDFGFTDPAALTYHIIKDGCIFSDEIFYESGLTNDNISNKMELAGLKKGFDEIWADAAEPKSIEEIYRNGFNIKACPKGPDSVEHGHQKVRQYKQFWTKRSLNCIKEQRNFRFIEDKNGKLTEKTTHLFSHGMDSRRYYVVGQDDDIAPSCGYV